MKKYLSVITAALLTLGAFSGCGNKKTGSASEEVQPVTGTTVQADPLAPSNTTAAAEETETTAATTAEKAETTTASASETTAVTTEEATYQPDPLGGGAFTYDENGAVAFEKDALEQDDQVLISAGQALFESACRTEWKFTVGTPYDVDINDYVENALGWQFYRITDSGITSMQDVEDDYHQVFSESHKDELSDLYMEENGAVYALSANRGRNIYYSTSKVTGIESKENGEIVFTVENYYSGSDFDDEPYSKEAAFSAVIGSDGKWKAGEFTLPY